MALRPDLYYCAVTDIGFDELEARGIRALLLDLDNTLVPRSAISGTRGVLEWLSQARARGIGSCIVSNNWHERVRDAAGTFGIPVVGRSLKPLPGGFRRGLELLGADASQAAVVGDQIFTDVLGGNLIGATTILVRPLAGGSDLPHTRVLRAFERRVLAGRQPVGRCGEAGEMRT